MVDLKNKVNIQKSKAEVRSIKINDFVENYYETFHLWKPRNGLEKVAFNVVKYWLRVCVVLLMLLYFVVLANDFKWLNDHVVKVWIAVLGIALLLHVVFFVLTHCIFNRKVDVHTTESLKEVWGLVVEPAERYELEMFWVEKITGGDKEKLEKLIKKVKENMKNRKPNTRDFAYIVPSILKNPYVAGAFVVISTVVLTIIFDPISNEINNENFKEASTLLGFLGFYSWLLIPLLALTLIVVFRIFVSSFELTTKGKQLELWRYEKLINTLSQFESVNIFEYTESDEKTQAKIENESKDELKIDMEDKIEDEKIQNF